MQQLPPQYHYSNTTTATTFFLTCCRVTLCKRVAAASFSAASAAARAFASFRACASCFARACRCFACRMVAARSCCTSWGCLRPKKAQRTWAAQSISSGSDSYRRRRTKSSRASDSKILNGREIARSIQQVQRNRGKRTSCAIHVALTTCTLNSMYTCQHNHALSIRLKTLQG